jgi:2'-5' RNA ligase
MHLFLALPLPQDVSDGLVTSLDRADLPRVRIIGRYGWHVILATLGDVPEVDVDLIIDACKKFTTAPGSIMIDRLEMFPSGGPKDLAGVGKESPREAWKTFIEDLRNAMLTFAPAIDRKPWRPHVVIGRGPKEGVLPVWGADVGPWTWTPERFSLVETVLTEEGTLYRALHEFPLNH